MVLSFLKVLSGQVLADHAYINAPASMRKGKNRRGLSKRLFQIAVGIDTHRTVFLRLGGRGLAGGKDSRNAFLGHVVPGSIVCHDMGHFSGCFPGCREVAVNSKDGEAHKVLNPVNRLCDQVKRIFTVHLRIHRKNVRLWLSEKAFRMGHGCGLAFGKIYVSLLQSHLLGKPSEDVKPMGFSNTIAYPS